MARLKDICIINPKSPGFQDELAVSFVPMPKVGEHGEFDPSEVKPYRDVKKGFTYFENGDVLFAKITPCMENGKGAIAQSLKNGVGFGSTEFHVLRPMPKYVTSKWLFYLSTQQTFRKEAEKSMTGSAGQKRVPKSFLEEYIVDLPDLSTQGAMTDALDKITVLISLRKQQLAKLDELVKARFLEMFGDPIENDKHLPLKRLGDICLLKAGSTTPADIIHEFSELFQIPCYGGNGIRGYVKESTQHGTYPIIGRQGALCGNVQLAKGNFHATEHAVLVTPFEEINVYWLYYLLKYLDLYRYHTGAAQPGLAVKTLNTIEVPISGLALQKNFAEWIEKVDRQKLTIQQSLDKLEVLKKSLMQEYFG